MDQISVTLDERARQFSDVLDFAERTYGSDSESANILRNRRDELSAQIAQRDAPNPSRRVIDPFDFKKNKDTAVMWIILGIILLFAFGGMSSMFVMMMATKW